MTEDARKAFHVAIVGAGIGGLALAMALHKKNVSFTLYEAAPEYSTVGAGIGFAPNGLLAMDAIEPTFRARYEAISIGNASPSAQNVFFEGLLLQPGLGVGEAWYGDSSWGHEGFVRKSAHRKALLDIMTSYIPSHTVQFGKQLTSISQPLPHDHANSVTLTFADTTTAQATILVGADGIKSTVRNHVLQPLYPAQTDPVYANAYCYRGVIPIAEAEEILGDLTHVAKFYFGADRCGVTYRISGGEEFNFLLCTATPACTPWPHPNAVTQPVTRETMMADFAGADVDPRFRSLLERARPIRWGLFHHLHTSTYHRGRVVIMGDAAHASLPFQAAGAAQGVEDAVVLAGVLERLAGELNEKANGESDNPNLDFHIMAAFEAYDSVRRPRAQKQVEQSAEMGRLLFFQDQNAGRDMSRILPRLQRGRFEWLWFHDVRGDVERAVERMEGKMG